MITKEELTKIVDEVYNRFTYKSDNGEDWRFLNDKGQIKGDCEDFSFTVIRMCFGGIKPSIKALLSGEAEMWRCRIRGEGHAVGSIGGFFFDNSGRVYETQKEMRYVDPHSWEKFTPFKMLIKFYRVFTMFFVAFVLVPAVLFILTLLS